MPDSALKMEQSAATNVYTSELQKTKINVILVFKAYNIAITNKNVSKLHFLFWLFTALCEEDTKLYCNWIRSRTRK